MVTAHLLAMRRSGRVMALQVVRSLAIPTLLVTMTAAIAAAVFRTMTVVACMAVGRRAARRATVKKGTARRVGKRAIEARAATAGEKTTTAGEKEAVTDTVKTILGVKGATVIAIDMVRTYW